MDINNLNKLKRFVDWVFQMEDIPDPEQWISGLESGELTWCCEFVEKWFLRDIPRSDCHLICPLNWLWPKGCRQVGSLYYTSLYAPDIEERRKAIAEIIDTPFIVERIMNFDS